MVTTNLRDELVERFERLKQGEQERALEIVRALGEPEIRGMSGEEFVAQLGGLLDPQSAREIIEAVEEGCEKVDEDGW